MKTTTTYNGRNGTVDDAFVLRQFFGVSINEPVEPAPNSVFSLQRRLRPGDLAFRFAGGVVDSTARTPKAWHLPHSRIVEPTIFFAACIDLTRLILKDLGQD